MSPEAKDGLMFGGLVLAVVVVLVAIVGFVAYSLDKATCGNLGEQAGVETKYDGLAGCFVKLDGKWFPADRWRDSLPSDN